jgi:hypothetical protein
VAKNALAILRKQRALLDRAIRALEQLQELRFAACRDSDYAAFGQAGAKMMSLCELDREELDQPSPFSPGIDPGND